MSERIFLIDGTAFAYRSFFAIRGLTSSDGMPTNAVFGFAKILTKILRDHAPSHIAVVFDAPGKTFRDDLYPAYKAQRPPTPEDLISQLPLIDEVVDAMNIPVVRIAGVEADDVIGTLARRAEAAGMEVTLVTGDKDALQLVTDHIKVFDPYKNNTGLWYDPAEVKERFGVPPEHVVDVMALMGDTADNVPGVKGIGEKTARALLESRLSLENLYADLDSLKGKQKERLEQDREMAFLSRELVTIKVDVPLEISPDDCDRREVHRDKIIEVFGKLGFQSLLDELLPPTEQVDDTDYRLVLTLDEMDAVILRIRAVGSCAVDTETTSIDPMQAKLVGISLSCETGVGWYIPVGHAPEAMTSEPAPDGELFALTPDLTGLDLATVQGRLRPLFADPTIGKIGHNIKYDIIVLERAGMPLAGVTLDTMVASYLTDPSRMRHNLEDVCLHYLKRKMVPIQDLIGKGPKAITFDKVPLASACIYASEDADIAWRLAELFRPILRERGLERLNDEVERPLIGVLARMEQAGVAIDAKVFDGLRREIEQRLTVLEGEIYEAAGGSFQVNSPKQLQEVLFSRLGLKPKRRTKTGFSTDVDVLEELAREHPLPAKILEYRTLDKLRGTYVEALPKLVNPETGRIHTSYNQAVAATGRLSSSDPNLQNIPIRTDIGRRIREGFVPGDPNNLLISADYSQIELRVMAHLSGDAHLLEAFLGDADIHRDTAARVFGIMPELVTPEMRRQAKAVNFGVIYGISPFGLAKNLGIGTAEAARFIEQYFAQYPKVRTWIDATLEKARTDGFVSTLLGRRRYVPELKVSDANTRHAAERAAINTPVQGTAADIIKVAMIRVDAALHGSRSTLLLQVHDELVIEVPADDAERVGQMVREIMEQAMPLDVPVKVDVGIGKNWAEIH